MNSSQETFESIEKYLRGDLPDAERIAFEERVSSDPELAEEVAAHRMADELVLDYALLKMKGEMATWHRENDSKQGLSKPFIGLSIVGLMVIGALVYLYLPAGESAAIAPSTHPSTTDKTESGQPKITEFQAPSIPSDEELPIKATQNQLPQSLNASGQVGESTSVTQKHSIQRKNLSLSAPPATNLVVDIAPVEPENCTDTLPINFIHYLGSCDGKQNGFIEFSSTMPNGENPVVFSIDSGTTYQTLSTFHSLENGTYHPMLQVSGGCLYLYPHPIQLTSPQNCDHIEVYVINLTLNEYWEPHFNYEDARIQIRNGIGALVFSSGLDNQFRWYGQDKSGEKLPMGAYVFLVESSGKSLRSGTITLLR